MTVGNVMHDLPPRPAAVAIRCVELRVIESRHRLAHARGTRGDRVDHRNAVVDGKLGLRLKFAGGITRIAHDPRSLPSQSAASAAAQDFFIVDTYSVASAVACGPTCATRVGPALYAASA